MPLHALFSGTQYQLPSDADRRGNIISDDQTRRNTKRNDDDEMDGDSGDNDQEIQNPGATGENTETRIRGKKKDIKEHDPDGTERSARDNFVRRDPRKSLMPNVSQRSTFHDSFGLGDLDSQVDCRLDCMRHSHLFLCVFLLYKCGWFSNWNKRQNGECQTCRQKSILSGLCALGICPFGNWHVSS